MMSTKEPIGTIVKKIVEAVNPIKIILFGSCARGDDRQNSDIDLLVIEEDCANDREESYKIRKNLRDIRIPIDILVTTRKRFEEHGQTFGMIYRDIIKEGRVIYEK